MEYLYERVLTGSPHFFEVRVLNVLQGFLVLKKSRFYRYSLSVFIYVVSLRNLRTRWGLRFKCVRDTTADPDDLELITTATNR